MLKKNREIHLNDGMVSNTEIEVRENVIGVVEVRSANGKVLFQKKKNMALIGGTQRLALKWVGRKAEETKITKLDSEPTLNIGSVVSEINLEPELFSVGFSIDGVIGNNQKIVKKHEAGYDINSLVPLRMVKNNIDDVDVHMRDYSLRSVEGEYTKYYLKKLNADQITVMNRWSDGIELEDFPDKITSDKIAETLVEIKFDLKVEELEEYFNYVEGDSDLRRLSAVTLFMGNECNIDIDGRTFQEHRNIFASNRVSLKNQPLGKEGSLSFIYRVYFI